MNFPPQPADHKLAREIKNKVCIDGHLNRTLDAVLASNSPDAIFNLISSLAHQVVDMTLVAAEGTPGSIAALSTAFRTTESCGPDNRHEMKLRFKSLEDLDAADHEMRHMLSGGMQYVLPVAKLKSDLRGGLLIQRMATFDLLADGAQLYADPRGPAMRPNVFPPPFTKLVLDPPDGQFGSWREAGSNEIGTDVWTRQQIEEMTCKAVQKQLIAPVKSVPPMWMKGVFKSIEELPDAKDSKDYDGAVIIPESGGEGKLAIFLNGRWEVVSVMREAPHYQQ